MPADPEVHKQRTLERLEAAWDDLGASYAGLPDDALLQPGVAGDWCVRDLIVHVATWEDEALAHLPTVLEGKRPPRYAATGGIDAFNTRAMEQKQGLSWHDVQAHRELTHARLLGFLSSVPDQHFHGETRFRHRLKLDTFGHYRLHAAMIREWRERE